MEEVARELIAPPSEEEESDEDEENDGELEGEKINEKGSISKYRSLLADIQEKESKSKNGAGDMEITWKDGEEDSPEVEEENEDEAEEELGPWQKYLKKKKDKKKERRKVKENKADALVSDEEGIPDGVDMNDPFFAEEFGDEYKKKEEQSENKKSKKKKKKLLDEDVAALEND